MSLTALAPENDVVPRSTNARSDPKWTPPHDEATLKHILERITAWTPFDVEAIFDDLDTVIGNQPPPVTKTAALTDRFHDHLKRLSDIAVADQQYQPTDEMTRLVERGRDLRKERTPDGHQQAVGLARRLAFLTSDLVDELIAARYIKGDE